MKLALLFLIPGFCITLISRAEEPECMKTAHTPEEINLCQHTEATRVEIQLKELEASIRAHLKGVQFDRFNAAEISWRTMTEKDCEIETDFYEGAPIYLATQDKCLKNHYHARMQAIQNYLCPDYSISNGCLPGAAPLPESLSPSRPAIPVVDSPAVPFQTTPAPGTTTPTEQQNETPKKIDGTTRFR